MPSAPFILPLSLTHSERKEYSDLSRLVAIVLIEKQNKKKSMNAIYTFNYRYHKSIFGFIFTYLNF
jgi:hypothetical protein